MDGQVVDIPLNQVGRRQAEGAGERYHIKDKLFFLLKINSSKKCFRLKDRRFTSVFSSDMTRTTETAQLILEQNEAGAERNIEVRYFFFLFL